MNYYVLVEGVCEQKIYPSWIQTVNPSLTQVSDLPSIKKNNFFLFCGKGYPFYKDYVIPKAIEDVNDYPIIDCLVIAIDSEEMSKEEKFKEINDFVKKYKCKKTIEIIVQHFCIETWGLGNRIIFRRNPQDEKLINYKSFFNVMDQDPELMPAYEPDDLSRVDFAYKYLHKAINDRYSQLTYSKTNPNILINPGYFLQLTQRMTSTNHISSLTKFIEVFSR